MISSVGNTTGTFRTNPSFKGRGFRSLTDAEVLDKRAKGLCFRCDEKFGPGHICPNKQLQVLLLEEGMDEESTEQESKREDEIEMKALQLSIYSISGLTMKKSILYIKLWGTLGDKKSGGFDRLWSIT